MDANDVYKASIEKWKNNKGIGTISYDPNLDLFEPIKIVLGKYFSHNPNNRALVIVADNERRDAWATKLLNFEHIDKIANDHLLFVTSDRIVQDNMNDHYELVVFDQIDRFLYGSRREILRQKYIKFKFVLGVTNSPDPDDNTFSLYETIPVIDRVTKVDIVTHSILQGTVEYNVAVHLSNKDQALLAEYDEYIKSTIEIFDGKFDLVNLCYRGNPEQGIPANHYREQLASSKGWSTDIDLNLPYYSQLDRYYNPNALYERAKVFYDILAKRRILMSDNDAKLNGILDIIEKNKDKKILIMNKRSAFAKKVADTINNKIKVDTLKKDAMPRNLFSQDKEGFAIQPSFFCVEYHPDVESRPVIDIETNDFIRYKSGANAGQVKQFGSTSLNRISNERFNEGYHNAMSTSNAIPKEADLTIDFIIITSSECDTLNQFQYRVNRLLFKENVKIINIYLADTKELDKFKEKQSLTKNSVIDLDISAINTVNF